MALTIEYGGFFDDIISSLPDITKSYFDFKAKQDALKSQLQLIKEQRRQRELELQRQMELQRQLQQRQQMQRQIITTGKNILQSPVLWIALGGAGLLLTVILLKRR